MSGAPLWRQPKVIISLVLVLALLGGGWLGYTALASLRPVAQLKDPVVRRYLVDVFRVEKHSLREILGGYGTARAEREVTLSSQVTGEVIEVHPELKAGVEVRAATPARTPEGQSAAVPGDLLVRIDPRVYEERLVQSESRLAESKVELERIEQEERNLERMAVQIDGDIRDARDEFDKSNELKRKGISTESDVRRTQMDLRQYEKQKVENGNQRDLFPIRRNQALQQIGSLENGTRLARLDLDHTIVEPPFSGVLSRVFVERGQFLKTGEPIATLLDLNIIEIPVAVTLDAQTKLLPAVRSKQFPAVAIAAHETATPRWHGQLVRISPQADEQSRTVNVYVRVDNREQETPLLPGTFVHCRIDGPVLKDTIAVPRDAILNGKGFVAVDGKAVARKVKVNQTLQSLMFVDSGLATGDLLILTNLDALYDQAPLEVQTERTLPEELAHQRIEAARLVGP